MILLFDPYRVENRYTANHGFHLASLPAPAAILIQTPAGSDEKNTVVFFNSSCQHATILL
jgi:hypothetical protein